MKKFLLGTILFISTFIIFSVNVEARAFRQCFYDLSTDDEKAIIEFRAWVSDGIRDTATIDTREAYRILINGQKFTPGYAAGSSGTYLNKDYFFVQDTAFWDIHYVNNRNSENIIVSSMTLERLDGKSYIFSMMQLDGTCPELYGFYNVEKGFLIKDPNNSGFTSDFNGRVTILASDDALYYAEDNGFNSGAENNNSCEEKGNCYLKVSPTMCVITDDEHPGIDDATFKTYEECKGDLGELNNTTITSHSCPYTFGNATEYDSLSKEEKDKYCNFDFESVLTEKVMKGHPEEVSKHLSYLSNATDKSYNVKKDIVITNTGETNKQVEIRPYSSDLSSIYLRVNEKTTRDIHLGGGSCKAKSEVYAYYDGGGYQITLSKSEAEVNSRVGFYCTGDGQTHLIPNRGDLYGCDVIPEDIREWIIDTLNLVKYVALVLVIVLGALDFIKAAASGEADQMKKSGSSFLKRVIAVVILFLVPLIVEVVLNLIEIYGADSTCIDITQ